MVTLLQIGCHSADWLLTKLLSFLKTTVEIHLSMEDFAVIIMDVQVSKAKGRRIRRFKLVTHSLLGIKDVVCIPDKLG